MWYAQAHPAEDFAETFAVWLQPGSSWRQRYEGWPALSKLEYVERADGTRSRREARHHHAPVRAAQPSSAQTLREHYRESGSTTQGGTGPTSTTATCGACSPTIRGTRRAPTAASFLREIKPERDRMVSRWTGEYQFTIDAVLDDMIHRCRELNLRAAGPRAETAARIHRAADRENGPLALRLRHDGTESG